MPETAGRAQDQFLYLTTTGRRTGLPREIEIWYVASAGKFYLLAEHGLDAHWVRNILRQPRVQVRVGRRDAAVEPAVARVLDETLDAEVWRTARRLAVDKYGWGDGLPVEITPDAPRTGGAAA
jgi:deazaflavin-dependent oxidoreductase (nitroreductase family)